MSILGEWTFSADGNGASLFLNHVVPFELLAFGTFGSGTVTAQFSPDGGTTWIDVTGVSLSAAGVKVLGGVRGDLFRPVLTGSTAPSLTVKLRETVTSA